MEKNSSEKFFQVKFLIIQFFSTVIANEWQLGQQRQYIMRLCRG